MIAAKTAIARNTREIVRAAKASKRAECSMQMNDCYCFFLLHMQKTIATLVTGHLAVAGLLNTDNVFL